MKKTLENMNSVYEEIWHSIQEREFDINSLSEFRTRVGRHYKDEKDSPFGLLIAGRCPNGWDEDSADQNHIFPQNNSPLIDVSKRIARHFYPGENPEEHLVWTNAAHICDVDYGNVGKRLWKAQLEGIKKIATAEQELLKPQVSVLLTGVDCDWDEPFWNYLSANGCSEPFREERIIETTAKSTRVCKFLAYECEGRLFIITDRPETFARQKFADKVCMIIDQWLRKNR